MIVGAFLSALAQFDDPRFRRAVWLGLALAVALLFAMYAAVLLVVQWVTPDTLTLPWIGAVNGLSALVPVASAFTGLFLDDVADAVEARHYPGLSPAPRAAFWPALLDSIRYFGLLVLLNLLGMLLFVFSGGLGMIGLWLINGFLLSREYFTMVALRRLSPAEASALRRDRFFTLWGAGIVMAIPLSVPLVNLAMPVIGAAAFTHLFHRVNGR